MTHIGRVHHHGTQSSRNRGRVTHGTEQSGRRPSVRLVSEAVVASYIHDISQRHRDGSAAPRGPRAQPTR